VKKIALLACALCVMSLSSCALLPEEETFKTAPIIKTYEVESYELAYVTRTDLIKSVKITCTYMPVQSEKLSFAVGGEYVDEIFVQPGEHVVKGQLLGQLNLDGVEDQIASAKQRIAQIDLQLKQLLEDQAIAEKKTRVQYAGNPQGLDKALMALQESYMTRQQSLEDSRFLAQQQLSEYEKRMTDRQIRAGLDGTLTYVRSYSEGARSVLNERVFTIADDSLSIFRAETEYWDRLEEGQSVTLVANKNEYPAVVASAASLGIAEKEKVAGKKAYVYFTLTQPAMDLEENDKGTFELVLDTRTDVLTLPEKTVSMMGDKQVVYYLDEEGIRRYCEVQTGLAANKIVEILSGLEEGDSVIVG